MWNDVNLFINVNQKAIKLFGLEAATYFAVITQIVPRVLVKQTADEQGFFPIDRHYVEEQIGLNLEQQYHCDTILVRNGILEESVDSRDKITVNLKQYFSVLTESDPKVLESIQKRSVLSKSVLEKDASNARAVKRAEERAEKAKQVELEKAKREEQRLKAAENKEKKDSAIRVNMETRAVSNFSGFSEEIQNLARNWVDSILGHSRVSYQSIDLFCQKIKEFSQNQNKVISDLLEIAIVRNYNDPNWVLQVYQDQQRAQTKNTATKPKVPQKIATTDSVDFSNSY